MRIHTENHAPAERVAFGTQAVLVLGGAIVLVRYVAVALPWAFTSVVGFAVAFTGLACLAAVAANRMRWRSGYYEVIAVWCVGLAAQMLLLPTVTGANFFDAEVVGVLSIILALAAWGLVREPRVVALDRLAPLTSSFGRRLLSGVVLGILAAVALSLLALGRVAWAARHGVPIPDGFGREFIRVVAAYFGGLIPAGVLAAGLVELVRWPLGSMLLGFAAGTLVYAAMVVALNGWPLAAEELWTAWYLGAWIGAPVGLGGRAALQRTLG